ncbi:hypothetical protein MKQ68_10810 [Chitinophaga horti]|uniref:Uncharacterized protein n=1 Tax=Chitinophaga horti TaxID=2920382 RepID=A0ABY6JBC6_9BACT|nr:hypothetical protein [Chitinophaga horti]UYQ95591.1 hypothetical protein MKQ68_10810 [Chitinophaga horti]
MERIVSIPILHNRQLCQANFTLALMKLEQNSTEEYQLYLEAAIKQGPNAWLEKMFYLAKVELEALLIK